MHGELIAMKTISKLVISMIIGIFISFAHLPKANAGYWVVGLPSGDVIGQDPCGMAVQQLLAYYNNPAPTIITPCAFFYSGGNLGMAQVKGYGPNSFQGEYLFRGSGQATFFCDVNAGETKVGSNCVTSEILKRDQERAENDKVCSNTGNPISILTGKKQQSWRDFSTGGQYELAFDRFYRSPTLTTVQGGDRSLLGMWWRTNFDAIAQWDSWSAYNIHFQTPDGRDFHFQKDGAGIYQPTYFSATTFGFVPANLANVSAVNVLSNSLEFTNNNIIYVFDTSAKLTSIRFPGGYQQNIIYNAAGIRTGVTDSFGRTIGFAYDANGYLSQVTAPDGKIYKYQYKTNFNVTALQTQYPTTDFSQLRNSLNVLEKVILPDATPATDVDNPTITHLYEITTSPFQLTGLTDQRGVRYATWGYTGNRATSSQNALGHNATSLAFDDAGNKITVTNALGKQTIYRYGFGLQSARLLSSIEGQASANCPFSQQNITYDANNFIATVTDGEGRVTSYTNDPRGRVTSITRGTGAGAATMSFTWHPTFNVVSQTVETGLTTTYALDATARVTSIAQTDTTAQSVPYSSNGQSRQWTFGYTGLLLTSIDGPLVGTGDRMTFAYDASGYLTSMTNEVGHVTVVNSVNGRGQPTRITDPNGLITDIAYNDRGAVTSIIVNPGANQRTTVIARDSLDQITSITAPAGVVLNFAYDDARRLSRISNSSNEVVEYVYNALGNATKTTAKAGTTVLAERNATFDELGRMLRSIGAAGTTGGRIWQFGYDKADNQITVTDPRSQIYSSGFDSLNRLVSQTEPNGAVTTLTLNSKDEVSSYKDPRNFSTTYVRNGFGEVIRRSSPDTGTTDYWYDARGLVTKVLEARGFETLFTYDNAGRRLTKTFTGVAAENVTYTYDSIAGGNFGKGRLTRMVDQAGSSDFLYDIYGNVTRETRIVGTRTYAASYGYDAGNRLISITYPSGRIVAYARDATGRISGVTTKETSTAAVINLATGVTWRGIGGSASGGGIYGAASPMAAPMLPATGAAGIAPAWLTGAANDNGASGGSTLPPSPVGFSADDSLVAGQPLLASLSHSNGLSLWRTYSNDHLLDQLGLYDNATSPATSRILRYHTYNDNLSLTNIFDNVTPAENQNFWLSVAGRLQNADGPWGQDIYYHDGVGNRVGQTRTVAGVATVRNYGYSGFSNQIVNATVGATTERSFTHDASGNLIGDNRGAGGTFAHTINRAGRISASAKGGIAQGAYTYDAFERLRVRVVSNQTPTTNNGTTHYVWNIFGQIIAEANGATGASLREMVYLDGMPLAAVDVAATPKKLYAVHVDHLNRPIMLTDAAKLNVWWASYEPFGKVRATGGALTQNLGLPGQWFQLETGLAYNWHRHYDPSIGRYTTADPLGFVDGPSVYAYAGNRPQSAVDPSGLIDAPRMLLDDMRLHKFRGGDVAWCLRDLRGRGVWTNEELRRAEKFFGSRGSSLSR
jgi:RHS repeat-associated protein